MLAAEIHRAHALKTGFILRGYAAISRTAACQPLLPFASLRATARDMTPERTLAHPRKGGRLAPGNSVRPGTSKIGQRWTPGIDKAEPAACNFAINPARSP
jgi:hypothetical protein